MPESSIRTLEIFALESVAPPQIPLVRPTVASSILLDKHLTYFGVEFQMVVLTHLEGAWHPSQNSGSTQGLDFTTTPSAFTTKAPQEPTKEKQVFSWKGEETQLPAVSWDSKLAE